MLSTLGMYLIYLRQHIITVILFVLLATPAFLLAQNTEDLTLNDLGNITYQGIYEDSIQLSDGVFIGEPFMEGAASRPTVTLIDHALGDLKGDGAVDAAVILAEDTGGSGTFFYLAAVVNQDGEPKNVDTLFLGDRIELKTIEIHQGEIIIQALTHASTDPFCCPSVEFDLVYTLDEEKLEPQFDLENTVWSLLAFGQPDEPRMVRSDTAIGIDAWFDTDKRELSGSSGCNSYSADFQTDDKTLTISQIVSTMMACEEAIMQQEQDFLSILEQTETYKVENDQLWMTAGDQILVFVPQHTFPDPTVVITSPQSGAELDPTTPIHVAGFAKGLFEGNVVVEILDDAENSLAIEPTIAMSETNYGLAAWTVDLQIDISNTGSGQIRAFSPSPIDGSIETIDRVDVLFGS